MSGFTYRKDNDMKIKAYKGQNILEVIDTLRNFVEENKEEYNTLKSDLNLYFTLKSDDKESCPLNERDYILTGKEVVDIDDKIADVARKELTRNAIDFIDSRLKTAKDLPFVIEKAEKKYKDSVEKKRKPDTIEKNKKELEDLKAKLPGRNDAILYLERVRWVLENENNQFVNSLNITPMKNGKVYEMSCFLELDKEHKLMKIQNISFGDRFAVHNLSESKKYPCGVECGAPVYGYDLTRNEMYMYTGSRDRKYLYMV